MSTRAISLTGLFQARQYDVALVQTDLTIAGHDRPEIQMTVHVEEASPNDVRCWLEEGSVQCESASDRPFEIRTLAVTLPRAVSLRLKTVSGDIRVEGLADAPLLRFHTVSGDIALTECRRIAEAVGHSVSGDVRLTACDVQRASIKTVSGDVRLSRSHVGDLHFDSVSGEVKKEEGSTVGQERARNLGDLGAAIAKKVGRRVTIRVEK